MHDWDRVLPRLSCITKSPTTRTEFFSRDHGRRVASSSRPMQVPNPNHFLLLQATSSLIANIFPNKLPSSHIFPLRRVPVKVRDRRFPFTKHTLHSSRHLPDIKTALRILDLFSDKAARLRCENRKQDEQKQSKQQRFGVLRPSRWARPDTWREEVQAASRSYQAVSQCQAAFIRCQAATCNVSCWRTNSLLFLLRWSADHFFVLI